MRVRCIWFNLLVASAALLACAAPSLALADAAPDTTAQGPAIAPTDVSIVVGNAAPQHCEQQAPQDFLIRSNWFRTGSPEIVRAAREQQSRGLDYRTQKYGRFEGRGAAHLNAHPPSHYAATTTFLGLPIQLNRRVIPALKCVEAALRAAGVDTEYSPVNIGGIRFKNTYRGPEVSNHVFGIALDLEPHRNTCCNCVAPWPNHPLCKRAVASIYERMAMPRSWVVVFERYGFYWLGHDVLQDTMHFEFLGDPDKILGAPGAAATPQPLSAGAELAPPGSAPSGSAAVATVAPQILPPLRPIAGAPLVSRFRGLVEALRARH